MFLSTGKYTDKRTLEGRKIQRGRRKGDEPRCQNSVELHFGNQTMGEIQLANQIIREIHPEREMKTNLDPSLE